VREAGRELTKSLIDAIDGKPIEGLQSLAVPADVIWQIPEIP
jgi:LacI family transcriptional regulator